MKLLTLLLSAFLATHVSANLFSSQVILDEALKVPGENPLQHCADPTDDILTLKSVDLDPNPPQPGKNLSVIVHGSLSETIEKGATVSLQVKYGLITIIKQTADLCDTVKNVDLECPLDKGDMTITKNITLPQHIPPGKYTVIADVVSKDDDKITCLTATMEFKKGKDGDDKVKEGL